MEVPLVVSEPVVTGPTELSVVNSGDELSISVEKAEVEWLEPAADWQPYWPSSQTLEDGPAALDVPSRHWWSPRPRGALSRKLRRRAIDGRPPASS